MSMVKEHLQLVLCFIYVLSSVIAAMSSNPPTVPARPQVMVSPNGSEYLDPYSWLRDDQISDPEVLSYLKAENLYAKSLLELNVKLEDAVLADMGRRVPRVETTPPQPSDSLSYWYGSRRGPGQDYWVHTRRPAAAGQLGGTGRTGPLSYGPNMKAAEDVVLDINRLARGFDYCDVAVVRPSPDGRYVAFTVDTVGNEQYELVVQEIGNGQRLKLPGWAGSSASGTTAFSGSLRGVAASVEWAPDSSAVFVLRLTPRSHEPYQLLRVTLPRGQQRTTSLAAPASSPSIGSSSATAGSQPPSESKTRATSPEVLLQDDQSGAVLELLGSSSCGGRYLVLSRRAQGYTTLLALDTTPTTTNRSNRPRRGVPKDVKLYGTYPWAVIAPESTAVDVLRAAHLYDDAEGRQTWAVLLDSDMYPDGAVYAVTDGDIQRRTPLVPGRRGRQLVNIAVASSGCSVGNNGTATIGTSDGGQANGRYLVIHTLKNLEAAVHVYDLKNVRQMVTRGRNEHRQRQRQLGDNVDVHIIEGGDKRGDEMTRGVRDGYPLKASEYERRTVLNSEDSASETFESSSDGDGDVSSNVSDMQYANEKTGNNPKSDYELSEDDENHQDDVAVAGADGSVDVRVDRSVVRVRALGSTTSLPLLWSFSPSGPGAAISSVTLDTRCWPTSLPYVRLSYSSMTTPLTTVDLDLVTKKAATREVEVVQGFSANTYRSDTLWATSLDGTAVPATVACRNDAWPPTTHRPLPCVVLVYGAYGRKLLPDFIPPDLTILDGVFSNTSSNTSGGRSSPMLLVIAHVRGGGELGSAWHINGKKHKKINTADDVTAVVQMLVQRGYCQSNAVAIWGRSAGGLAAGMALNRSPPATFSAAVLDVPFLDVLGAMTDPSLPLTVKERPEWGDPATSQDDFDYIQSYSPYEHVEEIARHTPAMLVTCSLNDPRVPYWGPAKYVARLRAAIAAATTGTRGGVSGDGGSGSGSGVSSGGGGSGGSRGRGGPVMLLTEMGSGGHFSASGASGRLAERAMRVGFLMAALSGPGVRG